MNIYPNHLSVFVVMLPSFTIVELFVFLTHCSYSLWSNVSFANIIPVSWLFFQLLILFLVVSICNRFTSIAFVVYVLGMLSEVFVYTSVSSMFSPSISQSAAFSSLIYFDFSSVFAINFYLWHMGVQFSQDRLWRICHSFNICSWCLCETSFDCKHTRIFLGSLSCGYGCQ